MTKLFRLDTLAPNLAERFRRASAEQRRRAARIACEAAVEAAGLAAPEINDSLAILRADAIADASLRERVETLRERLDDAYFRLDDEGHRADALLCFSRARATSAVGFALSVPEAELHEAIYESLAAVEEPTKLAGLVELAL